MPLGSFHEEVFNFDTNKLLKSFGVKLNVTLVFSVTHIKRNQKIEIISINLYFILMYTSE